MGFGDHLDELRRRIMLAIAGPIVGFIVIWVWFRYELMDWILRPQFPEWRVFGHDLLVLKPIELDFLQAAPSTAFVTFATISLIGGIILSAPWIIYHVWAFVAEGLYPHERRAIRLYGVFTVVLFFLGGAFFYFIVYPMSISFLYGFGESFNQYLQTRHGASPAILPQSLLDEYVRFVLMMVLIFGLMFELPLVVLFLGRARMVSVDALKRYRRHVILGLVVTSAIVTPPDVFSQVALALPMWLLYEAGILLVRITTVQQCPVPPS